RHAAGPQGPLGPGRRALRKRRRSRPVSIAGVSGRMDALAPPKYFVSQNRLYEDQGRPMKLCPTTIIATCFFAAAAFAAEPATKPATNPATRPVQITVDTSDAPELEEYGKKIKTLSEEWYPKIVPMLPSEGFVAPDQVTIAFKKDYNGVAAAGGTRITCSVKY